MNRRGFLKQIAATAAVGAVAPKLLAEPVKSFTTPWIHPPFMGANRVVIGATQYDIALDIADWTWKLIPVVRTASSTTYKVIAGIKE